MAFQRKEKNVKCYSPSSTKNCYHLNYLRKIFVISHYTGDLSTAKQIVEIISSDLKHMVYTVMSNHHYIQYTRKF